MLRADDPLEEIRPWPNPAPLAMRRRRKEQRKILAEESDSIITVPENNLFWRTDGHNAIFLTLLYFIQGIIQGLVIGSLPFLLKRSSTYTQAAIFSMAAYPFSAKLLWSPIVDGVYFKSIGRRKTWILPTQVITGLLLWWGSERIPEWVDNPEEGAFPLTVICFFIFFMSATGDIAVDGWALTMLSKENKAYASTCQTIGVQSGYFISFTVLLAFSSPQLGDKIRSASPEFVRPLLSWWDGGELEFGAPMITLNSYLFFFAIVYLATVPLIFLKRESEDEMNGGKDGSEPVPSPVKIYRQLWSVIRLPAMKRLIAFLIVVKIPFSFQKAIVMQLLDKGFPEESLAGLVLLQFPFEIVFAILAGKWSRGDEPLGAWFKAYLWRTVISFSMVFLVIMFPEGEISPVFFGIIVVFSLANSLSSCITFTSGCSFYARIADPVMGGTYQTLLTTLDNLGGMITSTTVLYLIDKLHVKDSTFIEHYASLVGYSVTSIHGFYLVVLLCLGASLFVVPFIRYQVKFFNKTTTDDWKVPKKAL